MPGAVGGEDGSLASLRGGTGPAEERTGADAKELRGGRGGQGIWVGTACAKAQCQETLGTHLGAGMESGQSMLVDRRGEPWLPTFQPA